MQLPARVVFGAGGNVPIEPYALDYFGGLVRDWQRDGEGVRVLKDLAGCHKPTQEGRSKMEWRLFVRLDCCEQLATFFPTHAAEAARLAKELENDAYRDSDE